MARPDEEEQRIADYMRRRAQAPTPGDLLTDALRTAAVTPQRQPNRLSSFVTPMAVAAVAAAATLVVIALLQPGGSPVGTPAATSGLASSPVQIRPGAVGAGDLVISDQVVELRIQRDPASTANDLDARQRPAYVVADPLSEGGTVWYRVQIPTDDLRPFGWLAFPSTEAADATLSVVEPRCSDERPVDPPALADLTPAERLLCFGREVIAVGPARVAEAPEPGDGLGGEPQWLISGAGTRAPDGELGLYVGVVSSDELDVGADEAVGIRGQFDHPAAASCERQVNDAAYQESQAEQELWCRQRFVFVGLERLAP